MALAALIFASQSTDDRGDTLRAALPLAGSTLLEHQVRRAIRAGAHHIVVLVERLPTALVGAIDRLRRDGYRIDIARSVADAAGRIHPDETVLLIADGCIAPASAFDRLAAARAPALLSLPDVPGLEDFERIDADSRWAGLALVEGARLQDTAAKLGEWDFALTLLRRLLQGGATVLPTAGTGDEADQERPVFARVAADLFLLESRIIAGSAGLRDGWPARLFFPLFERFAIGPMARRQIAPSWLQIGSVVLALLAVPLVFAGWPGLALALLVMSGPLASIAQRLADVRVTRLRHERWASSLRLASGGAALVALGVESGANGQWGWMLLAVFVVGVMGALASEWRTARRLDNRTVMPFMATGDGLVWMFIPFAFAGLWSYGIVAAALYAVTSFVVAQRMVHDAIKLKMRERQS